MSLQRAWRRVVSSKGETRVKRERRVDRLREHQQSEREVSASRITFEDYLSLSEITFEWGDSYDAKDWQRLRAILAPTLLVDYTDVNGHKWDNMSAENFVGIMSHIGFVGDPLVHTQHHIGASKWEKISDEEAVGYHQLRAAHQRYTAADLMLVENKGHGNAIIKHSYRRIDGEWKLCGLKPTLRWNEFEAERIFRGFEAT
ncbi:MAG: hypothetical protein Q9209_006797 [Squamulea sp. 1 TL-2023]